MSRPLHQLHHVSTGRSKRMSSGRILPHIPQQRPVLLTRQVGILVDRQCVRVQSGGRLLVVLSDVGVVGLEGGELGGECVGGVGNVVFGHPVGEVGGVLVVGEEGGGQGQQGEEQERKEGEGGLHGEWERSGRRKRRERRVKKERGVE